MSTGASRISVDVGALERLAGMLGITEGALYDDSSAFGGQYMGIDHPALRGALDDFDDRWSKKRNAIRDDLGTVKKALYTVSSTFSKLDNKLAVALKAAADSGAPGSGAH